MTFERAEVRLKTQERGSAEQRRYTCITRLSPTQPQLTSAIGHSHLPQPTTSHQLLILYWRFSPLLEFKSTRYSFRLFILFWIECVRWLIRLHANLSCVGIQAYSSLRRLFPSHFNPLTYSDMFLVPSAIDSHVECTWLRWTRIISSFIYKLRHLLFSRDYCIL